MLFGGLDTPVSLAIVPIVNEEKMPFMGPWAAGTPITQERRQPELRVPRLGGRRDRRPGDAPVRAEDLQREEAAGMILVNNPWGESNEKGLTRRAQRQGPEARRHREVRGATTSTSCRSSRGSRPPAPTASSSWATSGPSAQVVKSLDRMGWKVPIVSHWGPAGGRFTELAGPNAKDVHFIQTYSFFGKQSPVGEKVLKALHGEVSRHQGPGRRHARGRRGERLRRDDARRAGDRERRLDRRRRDPPGLLQDRELRRADQEVREAVHRRTTTTRSTRTTTSGRSSSTTRSCRSA